MSREKPSFWNAFVMIELASHVSVFLFIANVLALVAWYWTNNDYFFLDLIKFDLFLLLFFLIVSVWHYAVLSHIFITGVETPGTIVGIYFWMGMRYVTYEYQFSDFTHRSTERIQRRGKAKELKVGQKVTLFVNQNKPLQAINRDLYL